MSAYFFFYSYNFDCPQPDFWENEILSAVVNCVREKFYIPCMLFRPTIPFRECVFHRDFILSRRSRYLDNLLFLLDVSELSPPTVLRIVKGSWSSGRFALVSACFLQETVLRKQNSPRDFRPEHFDCTIHFFLGTLSFLTLMVSSNSRPPSQEASKHRSMAPTSVCVASDYPTSWENKSFVVFEIEFFLMVKSTSFVSPRER